MRPWTLVAGVVGTVVVITTGVWLAWPPAPEPVVTLERGPVKHRQARKERQTKSPVVERRRPELRKAAAPEKEPQLEPDDRASARQEFREERIQDLNDRLDAFAEDAGWGPDEADDVRVVLVETADHITNRLAAVDRGELSWDEARRELREYRLRQADTVRDMLGDEEFAPFVDAMDFSRFLGDEPVRGRLD